MNHKILYIAKFLASTIAGLEEIEVKEIYRVHAHKKHIIMVKRIIKETFGHINKHIQCQPSLRIKINMEINSEWET